MQTKEPILNAIPVFVLGLLSVLTSWFCLGIIFGIIGLAISSAPIKMLRAEPERYADGNLLNVGRILSIVGLSVAAASIILWLIIILLAIFFVGNMPCGVTDSCHAWNFCFDTMIAL